MTKLITYTSLLLCLTFVLPSCEYFQFGGLTKEEYMRDYRKFIQSIEGSYRTIDLETWGLKDKELYRFSHDLYKAHDPALSFQEKLLLGKYPIMYYLYRYKSMVEVEVHDNIYDDVAMLKRSLSEIMDTTQHIFYEFDHELRAMMDGFRGKQEVPE